MFFKLVDIAWNENDNVLNQFRKYSDVLYLFETAAKVSRIFNKPG